MAATLPTTSDCCDACVGSSTVSITGTVGWFRLDTIDDLRAQPSATTNTFASVGTLSGGFFGDFYWQNSAMDVDDGVTTIAPSDGGAGRWKKLL